jgi:hypothetical protein
LKDGLIRNAVNFPSVSAEEYKKLQPFVTLAERLGTFIAQMSDGRAKSLSVRYYGELTTSRTEMLVNAVLTGPLQVDSVVRRHARERADGCGRTRDRGRRVPQHQASRLHKLDFSQAGRTGG